MLELKCGEQRGSWPPIGLALGYNANASARKEQLGLEEAGEGERPRRLEKVRDGAGH